MLSMGKCTISMAMFNSYVKLQGHDLPIAMENSPFIVDLPIKTGDFQ